jgi:hypothetical protein
MDPAALKHAVRRFNQETALHTGDKQASARAQEHVFDTPPQSLPT